MDQADLVGGLDFRHYGPAGYTVIQEPRLRTVVEDEQKLKRRRSARARC